jgi:KEOPS complex subunit Cgi121
MIKIVGAKGLIKDVDVFLKQVMDLSQEQGVAVQVFDADVIFGKKHLVSAFEHAVRAFERKTNSTNSLAMEILLYVSGERQLKLAIPKVGVKNGQRNIAFVFVKDTKILEDSWIDELLKKLSLIRDDTILEGDVDTLRRFGLKERQIKTVTKSKYGDLILEKVAMVDIIK